MTRAGGLAKPRTWEENDRGSGRRALAQDKKQLPGFTRAVVKRETRLELATSTLGRWRSTN